MKIGNMLYPQSSNPSLDSLRIKECVAEAVLSEELGVDALWLAEHHFDGNSVYSDPVTFASHLAGVTKKIELGFAVLQSSLYHPVRLAEQLSLLDILSEGRLTVGLGRGTNGNIYEYQGYDLSPDDAQGRYEELTTVLSKLWGTQGPVIHDGKFWKLNIPAIRPTPTSKPHPPIIHSSGSSNSIVDIARRGEPVLMAPLGYDETARRVDLYIQTMKETGYSDTHVAAALEGSWAWRDIYVAESKEEAERVGLQNFLATFEKRGQMRRKVYSEQGLAPHARDLFEPSGDKASDMGFLHGTAQTLESELSRISALGIGGVFGAFRLGDLSQTQAVKSLQIFMGEVAPRLKK
ncbi:LLM class flavin-dependent oxidoreductase [Pseudomonas kitaguniensis]|uniref:LLM class flavin-dependent oxidoreductase n=1 Tax=Pseudomonas kitaguniensis TaxID=2607908 RepID=UPI003D019B09